MDAIREKILEHYTEHIASSFSCVEILDALYGVTCEPVLTGDDVFILSKGHAAPALYTILAMKGVLKWSDLKNYTTHCSHLAEGIPFTTGSLGYGLGLGCGVALAKRLKGEKGLVYVLLGDGELFEGSTWEARNLAIDLRLENLIIMLDFNQKAVYKTVPRFQNELFAGARSVDGHDLTRVRHELAVVAPFTKIAIFNTIKGKGIPELEEDPLCHLRKIVNGKIIGGKVC